VKNDRVYGAKMHSLIWLAIFLPVFCSAADGLPVIPSKLVSDIAKEAAKANHPAQNARFLAPTLPEQEVIRIAKQIAEKEGYQLADYSPPVAHFEYVTKDRTWSVFFARNVAKPGSVFLVLIDDRTGRPQLMPGM